MRSALGLARKSVPANPPGPAQFEPGAATVQVAELSQAFKTRWIENVEICPPGGPRTTVSCKFALLTIALVGTALRSNRSNARSIPKFPRAPARIVASPCGLKPDDEIVVSITGTSERFPPVGSITVITAAPLIVEARAASVTATVYTPASGFLTLTSARLLVVSPLSATLSLNH